jgi:glycosyltransferase involved in cell wall biosynthesis
MLNLSQGFADQGVSVDLVLAQAEGPYMDQVPESVRLVELNGRRRSSRRTLASLPGLVRYLRGARPAGMLSALTRANLAAVWARRLAGVPTRVVISEQNTWSPRMQESPGRYTRMLLWMAGRFYPWADQITAVSEGSADDLHHVARIPRERIAVVHNPVVTPELRLKARASLDHPWFEQGQPPALLAVGRLTTQKDYPTLVRAFAKVRANRPARLVILGEGRERPALETMVEQFGLVRDVSLPGFVDNPYAYMARAAVFVLSSKWEGLPTVLIEAMHCGAPVVSMDCPSGPREILQHGRYGRLVPVGDVAALADAIEATLDGTTPGPPLESWQPFELETVVNQYIDLLLGI